MNRLNDHLARLVDERVLASDQSEVLADAARQDLQEALAARSGSGAESVETPARPTTAPDGADRARSSAVLDVLGYVGGALLLGAVVLLGLFLWDDLDRTGRRLLAVASFVVPLIGGAVLVRGGVRRDVGRVLLALACYSAGFAWLVIADSDRLVAPAATVLACSVLGALLLRSGAFLVPGWSGAMMLVGAVVNDLIQPRLATDQESTIPLLLAAGFVLVTVLLGVTGLVLSRTLSWVLGGLSGTGASIALQAEPAVGEWLSLGMATLVASALLVAFVFTRRAALAVIGCLVVLSLWPISLYRIFDDALGTALGLVAAGAVLIGVVVVMSRRRRRADAYAG